MSKYDICFIIGLFLIISYIFLPIGIILFQYGLNNIGDKENETI